MTQFFMQEASPASRPLLLASETHFLKHISVKPWIAERTLAFPTSASAHLAISARVLSSISTTGLSDMMEAVCYDVKFSRASIKFRARTFCQTRQDSPSLRRKPAVPSHSPITMSIRDIVRPNILKLEPYRCARDDFSEGILLDANENTHGSAVHDLSTYESELELNRYPDPHQIELKKKIAAFRGHGLKPENLYLGVGSDESIDSLIRAVCVPGKDKILTSPPTYGMYSVSADINDVGIVKVPLDLETFELRPAEVLEALYADPQIKLAYFCSPGNPTGKQLNPEGILKVLEHWHNGIVVVDEAYVDFCESYPSMAPLVNEHPRLVVIQTVSKSFGLAGVRLGMCFASEEFALILNSMKAPYNISSTTSQVAGRAFSPDSLQIMKNYVGSIVAERSRLLAELSKIKGIGRHRGGTDANFLLMEVLSEDGSKPSNERALHLYNSLATERKIVVRFRGKEIGCEGCVRISVGTNEENSQLLREMADVLK